MASFVLAVRENSAGMYVGFEVDHMILSCGQCGHEAEYRLRYTENEQLNLAAHRHKAQRMIEAEHPNHTDKIRVG